MLERYRAVGFAALLGLTACGGGGGSSSPTPPSGVPPVAAPASVRVDGAVQKGPFLVGSTVLINLSRRPRTFDVRDDTVRDQGQYRLVLVRNGRSRPRPDRCNRLLLQRAHGSGVERHAHSTGDCRNRESARAESLTVNIMTHLINDRVLALLAGGQIGIDAAIAQAEAELIMAFQNALPVTNLEGFSGLSVYNTSASRESDAGNTYLLALSTGFY